MSEWIRSAVIGLVRYPREKWGWLICISSSSCMGHTHIICSNHRPAKRIVTEGYGLSEVRMSRTWSLGMESGGLVGTHLHMICFYTRRTNAFVKY